MARKSTQRRITETTELLTAYEAAGFQDTRETAFLKDMKVRLESRKGLSTRMRKWLDTLIENGVPTVNASLLQQITQLLDQPESQHRVKVLSDFRKQIQSGRELTERQTKFLTALKVEINDLVEGKGFQLSEDQKCVLSRCNAFFTGISPYYWQHRRGTANMLWSIFDQYKRTQRVTEKQFHTVCKVFKAKLAKIENPRFHEGDLAFLKGPKDYEKKFPCVIMSSLHIGERGEFRYLVLTGGEKTWVECKSLKKR